MKQAGILLLLAVLMLPATAVHAQWELPWITYQNARFCYKLEVPQTLKKVEPGPDNNDGRVFKSKDGKVTLTVYGAYNALSKPLGDIYQSQISEYKREGRRISYKVQGKDWFVISGITGKNVFYTRTIREHMGTENETDATFIIIYPYSEKRIYDLVAERLSRSFRFY